MPSEPKFARTLSKPEMMSLNPATRDRYVHDLVFKTLPEDKELTIRDVVRSTGLSRSTVLKHLQQLLSEQQIVSEEENLGAFRIRKFRRTGQVKNKTEAKTPFVGKWNYVFFMMDTGDGWSVVVQQREKDEVGIEHVRGAIAVDFDDLHNFLKELTSFVNKVAHR